MYYVFFIFGKIIIVNILDYEWLEFIIRNLQPFQNLINLPIHNNHQ